MNPLYSISGFAVGLLVGMTGVGGGSLMTPLLILLFGIHPAAAVGTDLLYAAVTKTAGSVVHGLNRTIDWRVVRRLAAGSVPMTVITIAALSVLDINGAAARDLINAVLDARAVHYRRGPGVSRPDRRALCRAARRAAAETGCGADGRGRRRARRHGVDIVGRRRRDRRDLPHSALSATADGKIVGSDIAHAVPLTLVAGIGHWFLGSVDFQVFGLLILGSVPGILLGSYAAVRIPERALRLVLAATLIVVATKLSFGLFPSSGNVVTVQTTTPH